MKKILIVVMIMFSSIAHADEWGTPDKYKHKVASAIGTVGFYNIYRFNDVENSAECAALTMIVVGAVKELVFDPSRLNKHPSTPSYKDEVANIVGAGISYGLIKVGEKIEDKYGFNPFYIEW